MTTAIETLTPARRRLKSLADTFVRSDLSAPPAELWHHARSETSNAETGRERRRYRRYSLITNVIVLPVDQELDRAGEPFVAVSSGMSVGGIRLIHTDPSPTGLLFLEIDRQPVRFVLSVLRSRPIGECFEIAGQLLTEDMVDRDVLPALAGSIQAPTLDERVQWAGVAAAVEVLVRSRK